MSDLQSPSAAHSSHMPYLPPAGKVEERLAQHDRDIARHEAEIQVMRDNSAQLLKTVRSIDTHLRAQSAILHKHIGMSAGKKAAYATAFTILGIGVTAAGLAIKIYGL